jgi:Transposase DDE domain
VQSTEPTLTEKDLKNWNMLQVFDEAVERVFSQATLPATFSDKGRKLSYGRYLSLFLFGLFNPVVDSMRGLCAVSKLEGVQKRVCAARVCAGSFSEMQHVLEPNLLRKVFTDVMKKTLSSQPMDTRLAHLNLVAQDGSLWSALPRMAWAEYGVGRNGNAKGVRLHLRFHLLEDKPIDARVTRGKDCERQALRQMCVAGQTNVGDRYYGEDYQLFGDIDQAQAFFDIRIKEDAVVNVEEELPLTEQDRAAGVVRHAWVRLGARAQSRSMRLRLVEIRAGGQHLLLVTNLPLASASAEMVGAIYRRRWSIELFFRWIKCILGCRHFFAESPEGVAIQLYLALIAALLFQHYGGRRPNKRNWELIQMYLLGWATEEELKGLLQKNLSRKPQRKKS